MLRCSWQYNFPPGEDGGTGRYLNAKQCDLLQHSFLTSPRLMWPHGWRHVRNVGGPSEVLMLLLTLGYECPKSESKTIRDKHIVPSHPHGKDQLKTVVTLLKL